MANDDEYMDEVLTKYRLEEGLLEPDEAQVEQIKTSVAKEKATYPKDLPTLPAGMSADKDFADGAELEAQQREIIGDKAGDGVVKTVAKGMYNGLVKGGEAVGGAIASVANAGIEKVADMTGKDLEFRFKQPSPKVNFDTNQAGEVVSSLTQFGYGYATGGAALKSLKILQGGTKAAMAAKGFVQGAYADFTAFKGDEDRLSDVLKEFDNPILNNAVTQYLAGDENDTDLEGRFKNVLEGGALGVVGEAVFATARGIKKAKKALLSGDNQAAEEIMSASKEQVEQVMADLPPEVKSMADTVDLNTAVPNKAEVINPTVWDKAQVKEATDIIRSFAHAPPETQVNVAKKALQGKIKIDTLDTPEHVTAAMNIMSDVVVPKFNTWTHAQQMEAAASRGMDLDTLNQYYKLGAVNEHVLLSSEILLKGQAERVTDLIAKGIDDNLIVNEVQKYQELLNMFSSFKNISGRTLDSNRIKLDLKKGNIDSAQRFMVERFGGNKNFNKFKEAWLSTGGDLTELAAINKLSPGKIMADSALEIWKNGLLSGFKTFAVNGVGNVANLYKEIGVRFFEGAAGGIRTAASKKQAQASRVYMGESLAMAMAQVDSFLETIQVASRTVKNGSFMKNFDVPRTDASELGYTRRISADYWGIGTSPGSMARYIEKMSGIPGMKTQAFMRAAVDKAGGVVNVPGNLLNVMDGLAKNQAKRTQTYALAYRKLMEEGVSSKEAFGKMKKLMADPDFQNNISEDLDTFAKRATFQEDLGQNAMQFQVLVKGFRPLHVPVLEFLIPFLKTPVNIFNQGVTEVNPVIAPLSKQFREGLKAGGVQADEVMGRLAFGSTLGLTGFMMASQGKLTGAGPADPRLKKALIQSGWRPYSIRFDNGVDENGVQQYKYVQYGRIEPVSWVIGSMASMAETLHYTSAINPRKEKDFADFSSAFISAMADATLDKSFFQGVSAFFEAAANPQMALQTYINRQAGSLVPAVVRDIEQLMQDKPYLRDVRSAEDAINARMIGKSGEVAVSRNRWGDPIEMDEGWFLGARTHFSPVGMSDKYANPIDLEIKRLAIDGVKGANGQMEVYPSALISPPKRVIQRKGMSMELDSHQYSRLLEIAGKEIKLDKFGTGEPLTMRDALNHLVTKDPVYKIAAPIRQSRMIKDVSKKYDDFAREQLISEYPELQNKLREAERQDIMSKSGLSTPENDYKLLENLGGR